MKRRARDFWTSLLEKIRFQHKTWLIFFFIVAKFHVKTGEKMVDFILRFLGIKNKTGWWFHYFNRHKIMKPPDSVGKKKWNWRHAAAACHQFHFFSNRIWTVLAINLSFFFVASFTWNWLKIMVFFTITWLKNETVLLANFMPKTAFFFRPVSVKLRSLV